MKYEKWRNFEFNHTEAANFYIELNQDIQHFYKTYFDL
ncbi:MAG: hypothetical protein PWR03_1839, partial [Tenuifilum sp.]|nr:hypothetical protein [Tenuifilum sp.]